MNAREHARYADDCGAYLLGALGDLERKAFEAHLVVCAECRRELDRLGPAADALPRSVMPLAPPPGLKRALMDVVEADAAERPPVKRRPLRKRVAGLLPSLATARPGLAWASAAFVLALGVAGGVGVAQLVSGDGGGSKTLSAEVDRSRAPSASGSLVEPAGGRDGAILRVRGLPPVGPGRVYQVWLQRGSEVIPGPTFLPDSRGAGAAAVPDSLEGGKAVMVTRERRGGARAPSEKPLMRVRI